MLRMLAFLPLLLLVACTSGSGAPGARATRVPATATPSVVSFSGQSQETTPMFSLRSGLTRFDISYSGDISPSGATQFQVWLMESSGKDNQLLGSAYGPYSSSMAFDIRNPGNYFLKVEANGAWLVTISQEH